MLLKKYLVICLIFLTINFSGCSLIEPEVIVKTKYIQKHVKKVQHPNRINTKPLHFYVVTPKNFFKFKEEFRKKHDKFVFLALSIKDYENLSLNISDIKRYIKQQKEIILYYEKYVADNNESVITKDK